MFSFSYFLMQISTINLEAKYAQPPRKINKRPETEAQAKS